LAGWVAFWLHWLAPAIGVKSGQTRWSRFAGVGSVSSSLAIRARVCLGRKMLIPFIF